MIIGTFRIGEDITVAIDAVEGDLANVVSVSAYMSRSLHPKNWVKDPNFVPITLNVISRAAEGEFPAGWNLSVPSIVSKTLRAGIYALDAHFVGSGGSIDITDESALIELTEAVGP